MGLLDTLNSITSSLTAGGSASPSQQGGLLPIVLEQLSKYPGGLGGLIASFEQGGLAEVMNSWVGTGQNLPVDPGQLGSVLHQDTVDTIAAQSGQGRDDVLAQLSQILPHIVNHSTPDGAAQEGQGFDPGALIGMLSRLA